MRRAWTDSIVYVGLLHRLLIGRTVKTSICPDGLEHGAKDLLHPFHAGLQQARIGWILREHDRLCQCQRPSDYERYLIFHLKLPRACARVCAAAATTTKR